MRQMPRPYTPPTGSSSNSFVNFVNEEEANESEDVIDDDFRLGHGYRSRRSMSLSSTAQIAPTPLSQSHTAEELGQVPKLTTNASQTNLSIVSGRSSKSRAGRSTGRDNERSIDLPTSPSSRTSFDRAMSYVSRRSDPEPTTRDERIRAARRKFEEKEAHKDRKLEHGASKRREAEEAKTVKKQERQRRKSEVSDGAVAPTTSRPSESGGGGGDPRGGPRKGARDNPSQNEKFRARSYEEYRPANAASLPRKGREAGTSEKTPQRGQEQRKTGNGAQSGWVRFSAWLQTRLLGCGGR